jgi:hypothetical protein
MLCVIMLNVIILSVIVLSVNMMVVVILSIVAPKIILRLSVVNFINISSGPSKIRCTVHCVTASME